MQYANSDLENLVPIWQRELPNVVHQPVVRGLLGSDVHVLGLAVSQDVLGNTGTLAQDVLGALIVRQGAVKRAQ